MEMPLAARNVVRVTSTVRAVYARRLLTCSFVGVKISKKEGLPRQHKDSQVSNAS